MSNANAITLPSVAALSEGKTAVLQVPKEIKFDMKRQSRPTIGPVEFIDCLIKHDEKASRLASLNISAAYCKWRFGVIDPASLYSGLSLGIKRVSKSLTLQEILSADSGNNNGNGKPD